MIEFKYNDLITIGKAYDLSETLLLVLDKNLDFSIIEKVYNIPKKIYLIKGSGTEKMKKFINERGI